LNGAPSFTSEEKQEFIEDYLKSPLGLKEYTAEYGIGLSTLTKWGHCLGISLNKKRKVPENLISKQETAPFLEQESPLFVDLSQSFQGKDLSFNRKENKKGEEKSGLKASFLSLVLSVPGGITITLDRLAEDQAARFIKGLL
jgi:hypothetical protein